MLVLKVADDLLHHNAGPATADFLLRNYTEWIFGLVAKLPIKPFVSHMGVFVFAFWLHILILDPGRQQ